MIIPLVARLASHATREIDRYADWAAAVQGLREDWANGARPQAAELCDRLARVPPQQRPEAVQDLIAEHLVLTWSAGRGPCLEAYVATLDGEYLELSSPATTPVDLVEDEFLARHQLPYGDAPALDEYARRFPGRPDILARLSARLLNGGRYVKLRPGGRGAMGVVWEAYDRRLRRLVAVKEPRRDLPPEAGVLERFMEEIRITAALNHPGIVSVYDCCLDDPAGPCCVMPLVSGRTLAECIRDYHHPSVICRRREQRLGLHELLCSFVKACEAVAFAHARKIVHCDLKPGNIVIGDFGEVVVLDWGMARRVPPAAGSGVTLEPDNPNGQSVLAGTPEYMAPEQAMGVLSMSSDVFSLGATLCEILTGQPPYPWPDGARRADWLGVVREGPLAVPRRLRWRTPRALQAICLKALASQPAARYASAADLASDVRRYLLDR